MRRRLAIAIATVATASVVLFAVPLAIVLHNGYRDQELLRLQRDTVGAARQIDLGSTPGDAVEIPPTTDRIAVYDLSDRRVAGTAADGPTSAGTVVTDALRTRRPTVRDTAGILVAAVPLLEGERVTGAIRAQRSDAVVDRRSRQAWLLLLAAVAALAALSGLAAALLGRRLAAPLEHVAQAARRLGEGDFSVRAPRSSIAEVDAVAAALDATAGRLDALITRERSFSADASHQLRTPLAALRLELETVELLDGQTEALTAAVAQVDRLQQTIDTLLSVARDARRPEQHTDLLPLISDLEARWRGPLAADARRLRVSVETLEAETRAHVTPAIVREILDVLLGNAHRHGSGVVTVTLRRFEDWRIIEVADEGQGVAGGDRVFERGTGSPGGHGIGLALARTLAHAEGGRLTLTRAEHHPVFTLHLPGEVGNGPSGA